MKIWVIAWTTFREAIRDRILYALLFFALVMITCSITIAGLTLGEFHKIVMDLGLAAMDIFGLLIAIFLGVGLVWREIERKTIYTIASKPLPRWQFVVGKHLGLSLTLTTEVVVMGAAVAATVLFSGGSTVLAIAPVVWLLLIQLLIVTAIALLFSCFTSPTLASFFTIGLVPIGRITRALTEFAEASESAWLKTLSTVLYYAVPDLQAFNVRDDVAYGVAIEWEYVLYTTGYGLAWTAVLLVLASVIFQMRDFR